MNVYKISLGFLYVQKELNNYAYFKEDSLIHLLLRVGSGQKYNSAPDRG